MIAEGCVAIIPARGGSKGLVGKNIRLLQNKPLIAWSIEAAKKSKYVTRVIVSTDCKEIAKVAVEHGAEVPFLRPAELSDDTTSSSDVLCYLIDKLHLENESVIFLQPTSPLRNQGHIDEAFEKFKALESDSLVSISKLDKSPYWSFWLEDDRLKGVCTDKNLNARRQDLPDAFALNGAIYIIKASWFKKNKSFMSGKSNYYVMDKASSIDIDDLIDFKLAEIVLELK